ncbi:Ankyrin repeat-containing protein [Spatholobus suberectus]|nr:Ankyrin repeat-containing protein [Spatholobus suberectus]
MSEREMGERKYITFDDETVKAQKEAVAKNWEGFKAIFVKNKKLLSEHFDLFGNTPIHAVARLGNERLLRELLQMLTETEQLDALRWNNCEENTLLHEVVLLDENPKEMVDTIMEFDKIMPHDEVPLLDLRNKHNETPACRAARHGKLHVLNYLRAKYGIKFEQFLLGECGRPILHTCVLALHFDVAIWLIEKVDKRLALQNFKLKEIIEVENAEDSSIEIEHEEVTCLKLLSKMPHAFKRTDPERLKMNLRKKLIYMLLPVDGYESELEDDAGNNSFKFTRDEESGQPNYGTKMTSKSSPFSRVNFAFWKRAAEVFPCIHKIWNLKKTHEFAKRLVDLLLDSEDSWKQCPYVPLIDEACLWLDFPSNVTEKKKDIDLKDRVDKKKRIKQGDEVQSPTKSKTMWETPLFMAAASGILEVVVKIVEKYPEAISYVNKDGLNILHVVVKHRQLEIYEYLKESSAFESLKPRLSTEDKRTILHQAASMEFFREEAVAGVAYELQRELEWYHRVKEIVPKEYLLLPDQHGTTAGDLLDMEHAEMHDQAKQWVKETAQSCSTVAVLIAGVVFAAAYAIPGGTQEGRPLLHNSTAFKLFTIMDISALLTSLGSVVMFLSILTSSFELWDFHKSLPGKLKVGSICLFLSLITTMLSFASTILLTIRMEGNKRITTLAYSSAIVLVSVLALTQFPLHKMVEDQFSTLGRKLIGRK